MGQLRSWQFYLLCAMSVAALVLVAVNISLFSTNRGLQAEVLRQQQTVNQGLRLSRLNDQIIRGLASLAAQTRDDQITAMLARHGVTFNVGPAPAGAPPGVPPKQ